MTVIQRVFIGLVLLTAIPAAGFGQNGSDINQATPIYFGQTINDTIDSTTRPWQVYAIVVSKGQQITVTGTSNSPSWIVYLLNPSTTTIAGSFSAVAQQGETCSYGCGSQVHKVFPSTTRLRQPALTMSLSTRGRPPWYTRFRSPRRELR
jgi:hypothetical protein